MVKLGCTHRRDCSIHIERVCWAVCKKFYYYYIFTTQILGAVAAD